VVCCAEDNLCERCFGRELTSKCGQARVVGACWAERICRGALRTRPSWPHGEKPLAIAHRLVGALAKDPRLRDRLAVACVGGAAAWWERRPMRYRIA
jgi:hypothetical protein